MGTKNNDNNWAKILLEKEKQKTEAIHQKRLEAAAAQTAGVAVGAIIVALIYGIFFSKNKFVKILSWAIVIGGGIYFFGNDITSKFKNTYCRYCGTAAYSVKSLSKDTCPRHPNGPYGGYHVAFPPEKRGGYVCGICGEANRSLVKLLDGCCLRASNSSHTHIIYAGPVTGPYKCVFCGKVGASIQSLVNEKCPKHPAGQNSKGFHSVVSETALDEEIAATGPLNASPAQVRAKDKEEQTSAAREMTVNMAIAPIDQVGDTPEKMAPKPLERYLSLPEDQFIAECGTFLNASKLNGISDSMRMRLANLLVFRDSLRAAGVPDEAFKASLVSGGIKAEGLADAIDSATDLSVLASALDTCFTIANIPDWMRYELKIRACYHHSIHDDQDRSQDIISAAKSGHGDIQTEVLVLEALEILRAIASPGMKMSELFESGNKKAGVPTSSADLAERIMQTGKFRGVAAQWIRELGKWGIAWDLPQDSPGLLPVLLSPGFPCKQIAADKSRVEEVFHLSRPAVIICCDGSFSKIAAGEWSWQFIDDGEDFREALDLVYLTPNGVVKPLLSKQRDEAREFDWPGKWRRECGQAFEIVQKGFADFGGVELAQAPVPDVAFVGNKQYDVPLPKAYRYFKSADLMFQHGMLVAWRLKAHFDASVSPEVLQNEISALTQEVGTRLEGMNDSKEGIHCNLSYSLPWELSFNKANLAHWEMRTAIQGRVRMNFALDETDEGYDLFMIVDARIGMLRLIERTLSMAGIPVEDFDPVMAQPIWGSEAW